MENNIFTGQQMMGNSYGGQQFMNPYGGYNPNLFGYQTMGYNNMQMPQHKNPITNEEYQILKNAKPKNAINLAIDNADVITEYCNHHYIKDGIDSTQMLNDGSGNVRCAECGTIFNPEAATREEVLEHVEWIINQMQIAKWVGNLPPNVIREYFAIIPLLRLFPDIFEYCCNNFNKYFGNTGMDMGSDNSIYNMYHSLNNYGGFPATGYMNPAMQGYYGQQPMMMGNDMGQNMYIPQMQMQQPMMNNGMIQNQMQMYTPNMQGNAFVNPMQSPMGGVNPMAPNQQFVSQANMMMNGSVNPNGNGYQQQQMNNQMQNQSPVFNTASMQQQPPVFNANAMQQQQQTQQQQVSIDNNSGPTITQNKDGSVSSKKKIDL